jgi:hypothetical protein
MGLDVGNDLFGNFHVNWAGTRWFRTWCHDEGLPDPFIGWASGDNSGDRCVLGPDNVPTGLAKVWCRALEKKQHEIAKLGDELIANQRMIVLHDYLYPKGRLGEGLAEKEWNRRALAAWYAILKNGVEHGDTLEFG